MGLIQLIVIIAVVGLLVWALTSLIPMPPTVQERDLRSVSGVSSDLSAISIRIAVGISRH